MDRDPRLCIVGAGNLSTRRIYPYIATAGAQLVGVCDLDQAKAEQNARRFGGKPYSDLDAMLNEQKPDGVIICVGPAQHAQLAPQVIARGLPVYTEKPPADSAAAALAVARAAAKADVLCTTAFKKRYAACNQRAREWIDTFPADDRYSISVDYASGQFKNDNVRSSFLLDFTIHVIDLIGYLFGDVERVFAFAKGPDAYAVSLKFVSGAVGSMNLNDGRSFQVPTEEWEISIRGGNFMTIHNSSCWRISQGGKPSEWREPPLFTAGGDSGVESGHLTEIIDFVNAIKEGRKTTRSNIYESYKSMVLYEAIRQSAETGEVVPVRYEAL